jgi:uncharacterized membrane protein (DUF4010 family)
MFSSRSRLDDGVPQRLYAAGVIMASSIMFVRVALLTLIFNKAVFDILIWPCMIMCALGMLFAYFQARQLEKHTANTPVDLGNPVDIINALGFALLYVAIVLIVHYADAYAGNKGLIVSGFLAGFADVDAISITMAKLALSSHTEFPVFVIVLAMISNTLVKILIAIVKGSSPLKIGVATALGTVIGAAILYFVVRQA